MKRILLVLLLVIAGFVIYLFFGSSKVTANVDHYIYNLPFKEGTDHKIVQGYGGLFSHKNKAALDFEMPVGTPVYAAREGFVYAHKDDSNEGGPFPKYEKRANYVIIRHSDGSFGCYWHLQKNSIVRKRNSAKGQLIAKSGNTGFVLRPHLHFAVKQKLNYDMNSFVCTKFQTTKGTRFLKRGETYERPLK